MAFKIRWYVLDPINIRLVCIFVPRPSARPLGIGLPRAAVWVRLNRIRTGVGRFQSSMQKWKLAPASIDQTACGVIDQTAADVILEYPLYRAPIE